MSKSDDWERLEESLKAIAKLPTDYNIIVDGKIYHITNIYEPYIPANPNRPPLTEKQKQEIDEVRGRMKTIRPWPGRPVEVYLGPKEDAE